MIQNIKLIALVIVASELNIYWTSSVITSCIRRHDRNSTSRAWNVLRAGNLTGSTNELFRYIIVRSFYAGKTILRRSRLISLGVEEQGIQKQTYPRGLLIYIWKTDLNFKVQVSIPHKPLARFCLSISSYAAVNF